MAETAPHNTEETLSVRLAGGTRFSIRIVAIISVCTALYWGKNFFLPVVFAFVLAFTFMPLVLFGERLRLHRALTASLIMLVTACIIVFSIITLSTPFGELIDDAPRIGQQLSEKLRTLREPMEAIDRMEEQAEKLTNGGATAQKVVVEQPGLLSRTADDFAIIVANIVLTLVLTFFLLISREMFLTKVIRILPKLSDQKNALRIAHDIETDVSAYLITIAAINTGLGIAVGTLCWYFEMPTPLLFGVMAALLNFLPYVGSAIGILITGGVALISLAPVATALLVPLGYALLTILEGQFITPTVLGRRFSMNTVVILISIAFWGFMWGMVGVLLAVPILIIIKSFCEHVQVFSSIAEFISGAPAAKSKSAEDVPEAASAA